MQKTKGTILDESLSEEKASSFTHKQYLKGLKSMEELLEPLSDYREGSPKDEKSNEVCLDCKGRKKCSHCQGLDPLCPWCEGSGKCLACS
ncbi:MAG: hypothetical protein ACFFB3_18005 [Candidatus Hodarchaeota archaeon]